MSLHRHLSVLIAFGVALLATVSDAAGDSNIERAIPAGPSRSNGSWKVDKPQRKSHRWNLDVRREKDDRISGRIDFGDSALAKAGNISGSIKGAQVSGTIADDAGNPIANFDGQVTASGIAGRYRDRSGEEGDWSWEGRLK